MLDYYIKVSNVKKIVVISVSKLMTDFNFPCVSLDWGVFFEEQKFLCVKEEEALAF